MPTPSFGVSIQSLERNFPRLQEIILVFRKKILPNDIYHNISNYCICVIEFFFWMQILLSTDTNAPKLCKKFVWIVAAPAFVLQESNNRVTNSHLPINSVCSARNFTTFSYFTANIYQSASQERGRCRVTRICAIIGDNVVFVNEVKINISKPVLIAQK